MKTLRTSPILIAALVTFLLLAIANAGNHGQPMGLPVVLLLFGIVYGFARWKAKRNRQPESETRPRSANMTTLDPSARANPAAFCGSCGAATPDGDRYCHGCGALLSASSESTPEANAVLAVDHRTTGLVIGSLKLSWRMLAVALVVAVCLGGFIIGRITTHHGPNTTVVKVCNNNPVYPWDTSC